MRKLLFILFLVLSIKSIGQSRIGYSYDQIRKEFNGVLFEIDLTKEIRLYSTYNEYAKIMFAVDTESICIGTLIIPNNKTILDIYINQYNTHYKIVSKTKWIAVIGKGKCDIILINNTNNQYNNQLPLKPYFLWTER